VSRAQLRAGLVSGIIGAAATAGALLGVGRRLRTPARPFNAIAAHLLGPDAQGVWAFEARITLTGLLVHLAMCCLCGVAFSAARDRFRGPGWVMAFGITAVALVLSLLSGSLMGTGLSALLSLGDLVLVYAVLAVALAIGVQFASALPIRDELRSP
jgi:hypothetical protein